MLRLGSTGAAALTLLTTTAIAQAPSTTGASECFGDIASLRAAGLHTSYRQTNSSDSDPLNIHITGGNGGRFAISIMKYGDAFARGTARVCQDNGRFELRAVGGNFTAGPAVERIGVLSSLVRGQINSTSQINLTPTGNRLQANLGGPIVLAPAGAAR